MKYGVNSVPIDVRNAVNDVAGHLNSDILNDIIDGVVRSKDGYVTYIRILYGRSYIFALMH